MNENLSQQVWLEQSQTKIQFQKLKELRELKIKLATQHAANSAVNPIQLQLLLREASVIEEVIEFLQK